MMSHAVRNEKEALAYMIDCTLATVEMMAMRARPSIGDLKRQCSLAQRGIKLAEKVGVDLSGTRARNVKGTLEEYVQKIRRDCAHPPVAL